jgi:GNAT superfamily N-acetyltransferase
MSGLRVTPVATRRELDCFLEVPYALHARDARWTPPLKQDLARSLSPENPLFQKGRAERTLFLAWQGDRAVGRVLAHVHHGSNQRHGERAGFFGLLEFSADQPDVGGALMAAVAEHHRARGLREVRGPYELTVAQCLGAVVAGFDEPAAFSQSWNGPHVPALLRDLGYTPVLNVATFRVDDLAACDPDSMLGPKQRAWLDQPEQRARLRLRQFDMDEFDRDMRAATSLLNEAFAGNYGFVPLSDDELAFMAGPMKRVVRPELTVFLELDGAPAGVALVLPDFNVLFRRMNGRLFPFGWAKFWLEAPAVDIAVGQFIATDPRHQNQGLMRLVIAELVRRLQRAGVRIFEGTWISESNAASRAQMKALGGRIKHELQLFSLPLR